MSELKRMGGYLAMAGKKVKPSHFGFGARIGQVGRESERARERED